jgi:hypothetical protein
LSAAGEAAGCIWGRGIAGERFDGTQTVVPRRHSQSDIAVSGVKREQRYPFPNLLGHFLNHQHGRLVGVVVSNVNHAQGFAPNGISFPALQFGTALASVGGFAGSPSTVSSLNRKAIPSPPSLGAGRPSEHIAPPAAVESGAKQGAERPDSAEPTRKALGQACPGFLAGKSL